MSFIWPDSGQVPAALEQRLQFDAVLCRSTGDPLGEIADQVTLQYDRQLNVPVGVTLTVNMESALYAYLMPSQLPRLKVYRPPTVAELAINPGAVRTLVFYGDMIETSIEEDAELGQAKIVFQDPRWHWNDLNVKLGGTYIAGVHTFAFLLYDTLYKQLDSPAGLGGRPGGRRDFVLGNAVFGGLYSDYFQLTDVFAAPGYPVEAGKNIAALIDEVSKADNGPDVDMKPFDAWDYYKNITVTDWRNLAMGVPYSWRQQGSDKTTSVHFIYGASLTNRPGELPANCGNMQRRWTKIITSVTTKGTDSTTGVQSIQTYAATSPYGLREEVNNDSSLVTTSSVMYAKSVGRVLSRQNPIGVISIINPTREAPQPLLDFDIGDTVLASCRRTGMVFYNQRARIHGFTIVQDANKNLAQTITIAGGDS